MNGMQRLKAEVVALSELGLSHLEIAQRLGVSRLRVDALLRRPRTFLPRMCELCGDVFTPTGSRQRFCTAEHREQHHRREPKRRACLVCGEEFTPTNGRQRFCTPEHREQHHREPPKTRECRLCGAQFTPTNGRQRFCTPEHRELYAMPRTLREARERVQALEAEIARVRDQLGEAA